MLLKYNNFRVSLYSPSLIFFASISACLFLLLIERLVGIEWDFHPDAITYITLSNGVASNLDIRSVFGSSFYILVDILNSKVWLLIAFNIFIYSITNVALILFLKKSIGLHKGKLGILFLLVVFNPYRIHLSVHVLKDTLIIFGLVYFFTTSRIYSWLLLLLTFSLTNRTAIYLITIISKKNLIIVAISVISFIALQSEEAIFSILNVQDQVDMRFRDFDQVPSFFEFGLLGAFIRAIVWPFLYLTGVFFLLSPSIMYLPIAVGSLFLQFWHFKEYRRPALYFKVYLSMSVLAFLMPGFTSFIRYSLPLLTILPILLIKENITNHGK